MSVQNFQNTIEKILDEETQYSTLNDIPVRTQVQIENDITMDLHIYRKSEDELSIAHYRDGNPRKPDPILHFKFINGLLQPIRLKDTMQSTKHKSNIRAFMNKWSSNLEKQFL